MVGYIEAGGEDKSGSGSRLNRVTFVQPPRPASLGNIVADIVALPASTQLLDLTSPGPNEGGWHFGDVSIGQIESSSPGLVVRANRTIIISKLPDDCTVEIAGEDSKLVMGREAERASGVDLKVSAPKLHLVRGVLDGVSLIAVTELEVGPAPTKEGQSSAIGRAYESALGEVVGMAMATRVTGEVDSLIIHEGCTVAGDALQGFCARQLAVAEQSEVSGLAAQPLSIPAITGLARASRSGLWVPWSSRAARRQFEREALSAQQASEVELGRLSNRRALLLEHAVASSESGHVLSVLQEAEKDSRRRLLPLRSRERLLLETSRWMVGYGERIGWPLGVDALLLAVLAGLDVGWSNLTSSDWWSGFAHVQRYESAFEFALPGIDVLGIEASEGLWGLLAKLVSVVFIATAVRAGFRVLRRHE